MHAVIMAGGKGVRLRPFTTALPKPLVPIGDEHVILDIVLEQLAARGFTSVTIAINHLGHLIEAYVGSGQRWGLVIDYAYETTPLSTVGPLFTITDRLPETFLVMNGDIITSLPFDELLTEHTAADRPLTVATSKRESVIEFGVLDIDNDAISGFTKKPALSYHVSMGVYAMTRATVADYPPGLSYGFDQLILDLLAKGTPPTSYAFDGLWMDIGRPRDYDDVNERFAEIRPELFPQPWRLAV